jgi:hypothetical protein
MRYWRAKTEDGTYCGLAAFNLARLY